MEHWVRGWEKTFVEGSMEDMLKWAGECDARRRVVLGRASEVRVASEKRRRSRRGMVGKL